MIAIQNGAVATSSAARPLGTHCSAQTTARLPTPTIRKPTSARFASVRRSTRHALAAQSRCEHDRAGGDETRRRSAAAAASVSSAMRDADVRRAPDDADGGEGGVREARSCFIASPEVDAADFLAVRLHDDRRARRERQRRRRQLLHERVQRADRFRAHLHQIAVVAGDGVHFETSSRLITSRNFFQADADDKRRPRAETKAVMLLPIATGIDTAVVPRMTPCRSSLSRRSATAGRERPICSAICAVGVRPSFRSSATIRGPAHPVRQPYGDNMASNRRKSNAEVTNRRTLGCCQLSVVSCLSGQAKSHRQPRTDNRQPLHQLTHAICCGITNAFRTRCSSGRG
jgi:hypothetical protein